MARFSQAEVNEYLDDIFLPLDLEGQAYVLSAGRQYHGSYEGRGLHIFTRAVKMSRSNGGGSVYMGHNLELLLDSPLKTRATLVHSASLNSFFAAHLRALEPVPVLDFTQNDFSFQAHDVHWAMSLVDEAKELMLLMAQQDTKVGFSSLNLYPEAVSLSLRLPWDTISQERVADWLEQLLDFATIAESLPPPMQPLEESKTEHDFRLKRGMSKRFAKVALAIAGGIMVLVILAFISIL
ncbi:MAG: hypothetical protein KC422_09315 [Trueperaceae bacterium]|nr:hypothetical protein [Trueperaceae bacterium]